MNRSHRQLVDPKTAYSSLAPRYLELMDENPIIAHSARVSLGLVRQSMNEGHFLLEIGCGIGRETLELAAEGKSVVACDPSEESLRILEIRAAERGLRSVIRTRTISASRLIDVEEEFGQHVFDGAYSSFALSYEPNLRGIPEAVWRLLRPGAPFLCSILNRLCLSEIVTLAPFLLPRRAFGRLLGTVELSVDRLRVLAKSYGPWEVIRAFDPYFSFQHAWGIPSIIPPHYLHKFLRLTGAFRSDLEITDRRVNDRWPFKHVGSHTAYLFAALSPGPSR